MEKKLPARTLDDRGGCSTVKVLAQGGGNTGLSLASARQGQAWSQGAWVVGRTRGSDRDQASEEGGSDGCAFLGPGCRRVDFAHDGKIPVAVARKRGVRLEEKFNPARAKRQALTITCRPINFRSRRRARSGSASRFLTATRTARSRCFLFTPPPSYPALILTSRVKIIPPPPAPNPTHHCEQSPTAAAGECTCRPAR